MTYEEALDILIAGPPDHGDDEIFANDGEEEADSHYTPQIVKLLAGKCNIKWEWTTQDLETPHGSKRNAHGFEEAVHARQHKAEERAPGRVPIDPVR